MQEKKELRRHIRELKKSFSEEELREMSVRIWKNLEQEEYFRKAEVVAAYWSMADEVYTHDFIKKWADEKIFLLPTVKGDDLEFRIYEGEERLLQGVDFAVQEPTGPLFTAYEKIDLLLVPGMAFDSSGNRLGRGKGFYDRFLRSCTGYKVGICYPFQYLETGVPTDIHDEKVDAVKR